MPSLRQALGGLFSASWLTLTAGTAALGETPAPDPTRKITQYVHDVWQTDDGLPANDVQAILHGRGGYLWLATRGGLVRFDGVRFTVFNMVNTPLFASDDFGALAEGPDGSLWVASRGAGIYRHRGGRFTAYPGPDASRSDVRALLVDDDGELWAGSLGGLLRLRGERLAAVEGPALASADVRALHQDADGALWIGTNGNGVYRRLGDDRFEPLAAGGLAGDAVNAVLRDPAGNLWLGTTAGLKRLADGEVTVYRQADGLIDDDVQALHMDASGSLWIGTNSGLARLRDGGFESYTERTGIAADLVRAVTVDREGNLWVGTYGSGLHRFKVGAVTAVSASEGLSHDGVWSIYGPPSGGLLVGFGDGDIDRIDFTAGRVGRAAASPLDPAAAFPQAPVYSMYGDPQGTLWVGTGAGLVRYRGRRTQVFTAADGLPDDRVRIVYPDPQQPEVLWLGTFAGVAVRSGESFERHGARELAGVNVRALLKDRDGALWVGVEDGLVRLHDGAAEVFTTADGLGANAIRALYQDPGGDLWIGTRGGGLTRRRGAEIRAYTTRQGLPHNDVWAILEDGDGHLWWSSDQGLTRARKADFDAYDAGTLARIAARSYGLADGMKIVECNGVGYPSGWKSSDGMLHFASMGGVVLADPRPRRDAVEAAVYVESLLAGGTPIEPVDGVELAPAQRNLEIAYTSPRLGDPGRVRFRYRLSPYDRDWVDAGFRRTAFYTHLRPGAYRFRVGAGSDEAGWSDGEAELAFTVRPFFYETWWFLAAGALASGLAVSLGFRWRTRAITERNRRLQAEIDQRRRAERELAIKNAELEAKNRDLERFTYTVSHDLKAPLVTIRGFLGLVRRDAEAGDGERLERDLGRIDAAAAKMAELLEDLLALSRVDAKSNPVREVELGEVARDALERTGGGVRERGVEVEIADDLPLVRGDAPRLAELFQNLLENAVKYMGDQPSPRIEVGWRRDGTEPVFTVRDNGIGIDPEYHDKVFGLFERLDSGSEGTGVGLALARRIVEVHGGRIWVESAGKGHGSTFCFTLPGMSAVPAIDSQP